MPRQAGKSTEQHLTVHPVTPGIVTGEEERVTPTRYPAAKTWLSWCLTPRLACLLGHVLSPTAFCPILKTSVQILLMVEVWVLRPILAALARFGGCGDFLLLTQHLQKPHLQLLARNGMFLQYVEALILKGMIFWWRIWEVMRFA